VAPAASQPTQPFQPPQPQGSSYGQQQAPQPYGQAGQVQSGATPSFSPQQQNFQAPPPQKKKSVVKIVLIIVAILVVGCIATFVAVFGAASCSLNDIAEAEYYEIGSDKVPSVKTALGTKYDVTGSAIKKENGQDTLDIVFKTDENSGKVMERYASYLNDEGWLRIQDADFAQSSNPASGLKGFQLAKNSTTPGYVVVVTLYWEPNEFNLVIDRLEGDVSSEVEAPAEVAEEADISLGDIGGGGSGGIGGNTDTQSGLLSTDIWKIFDSRSYHMEVIVYTYDNLDGTVMEYWISNPNVAMAFEQDGETYRLILKDGKQYVVIDSQQLVAAADNGDTIEDVTFDLSSDQTFIGTGEGKFYGGVYYYEAYEDTVDGSLSIFYFDKAAGIFMGVRLVVSDDDVTDMVFLALDNKIDASAFDIPSSYQVIE
jgi:hypothetical protein